MSETANIARMAEKLSDDLFSEFFWVKTGPMNVDWRCEHPEAHGVKSHPTDVVFFYDEPYSGSRRYIQCDLKSYAKASISKPAMKSAILSLAKQLTCAEISEEWRKKYVAEHVSAEISGLLFVYNHDSEFDANFDYYLGDIKSEDLGLGPQSRLFVLGPDDINWLDRVATEIRQMRGKGDLPDRRETQFFHPQLIRKSNVQISKARAATLEMLTSPWFTLKFDDLKARREGIVVFHRRKTSVDGLVYLLDYLRHYQLLDVGLEVTIKTPQSDDDATNNLQKAVEKYIDNVSGAHNDSEIAKLLRRIAMGQVPESKTSFSTDVIGMEYAR
jgi:hypothetical protein